jgi:hypothetical protein
MIQKHRIRTEIGKDQRLTVELKQDYDLLEILSLKFTQKEIYTSLCADYGVVCGRISVNDGYGVSNARVSIFIPLTDEDGEDPVISALYPYTLTTDRNDDGYRYNLLPSRKQHTGHTPTGTFPDQNDILSREEVLEVYEKYYKYTVKTNDSGDFMIWGVPVGSQTIHVDVDLSDMGCQSMVPYDFIYEGLSEEKFENNYTFRSSNNLEELPQIVSFEKTIEVYPFWGNEDLCEIGITRTDFDLKERGIRLEPYSIMMGGSFTDSGKDSVRVRCNVDNQMGEKCNLTTGTGDIEAIRFSGRYEKNPNGSDNYSRPILESIQLDSQIDEDGNFFFRVPMNMNYYITNEFGDLVQTMDTRKGIPTRGTYRFRLSLQNDNGAKKQYRGKYLIPQIKEHQLGTAPNNYTDPKSYAFSTNLDDYPDDAIDDIIGLNNGGYANDYFYSFRYNRIYTVSSFINQYYNKSWAEKNFSLFVKDKNESFIGIKEIQPSQEEDCSNNNEYFPINDAVSNFKFKFLIIVILNYLERIYLIVTQFAIDFITEFLFDIAEILYGFRIYIKHIIDWRPFKDPATRLAKTAKTIQILTMRRLGLINYPDCYECGQDVNTGESTGGNTGNTYEYTTVSHGQEESYITNNSLTPIATMVAATHSYDPNAANNTNPDETISLTIPNVTDERNYIIKYVLTAEELDAEGIVITPETYEYRFVGYGSAYPITGSQILAIASDIHYDVYEANNLTGGGTLPSSVTGTALESSTTIRIYEIYFVSELTQTSSGVQNVESGCEKYDIIYDSTATQNGTTMTGGDMALKAYINDSGSKDYNYFTNNVDEYGDYPDIFQTGSENPCTYQPPTTDIVVSFSRYAENHFVSNTWGGQDNKEFPRRVCLKSGWVANNGDSDGTASGYSEFSDGQYTLVAATGKNRELILNYSRRKLVGKLMCGGITSYTFSNSWLNGSLYFFQFRRRRGGSNAKYCKDLIYRNEDQTGVHYYYRSTPYYNGNFIGQVGERSYGEILFPTTVMDLGPRNMYINEICVDPELDVNCSISKSIGSTSYQDINDLMEYVIASKEVKEQGRLEVQDLFDRRSGGKIDGDIAQLLNFNSQMGLFGYDDEDPESPYYTSGSTIFDGAGPLGLDFVFSEDDEDTVIKEKDGTLLRLCINSAGNLTETAQEVPYFRWNKRGDGFGPNGTLSENQDWNLNTIYSTKYQGGWNYVGLMENDPYNGAGGGPTDNINSHYYDGSLLPPIRDCNDDNYAATEIPIGGPFFFYFGLRTGKTSWNKFIKNFGPL